MKDLPFDYDHSWSLREAVARQVAQEDERTWAKLVEVRQLMPDTLPQTVPLKPWSVVAFARSAMP